MYLRVYPCQFVLKKNGRSWNEVALVYDVEFRATRKIVLGNGSIYTGDSQILKVILSMNPSIICNFYGDTN